MGVGEITSSSPGFGPDRDVDEQHERADDLGDEVRHRISPGRITTAQWIDLIQTAHEVGIPTTSTIMYGHIESSRHKATHLAILRDIQKRTGGIRPAPSGSPSGAVPAVSTTASGCTPRIAASNATSSRR